MDRDRVRAGLDKSRQVMIVMLDHQMHIERKLGLFTNKTDDRRSERNVVYEMAVHDIAVEPIRTGVFDYVDIVRESGEISGQNRGGDEHLGHGSIYIKSLTPRAAVSSYPVSAG